MIDPRLRLARWICGAFLVSLLLWGASAGWTSPYPPDEQFRDSINAPPSRQFFLGTDDLGRDRYSRLMYATRVSVLLAPAASLLSVFCAAIAGALAALLRGPADRLLMAASDLTLSLPWLMLLVAIRAVLPLDVAPAASLALTFALLGCLGWAGPARVIRSSVLAILDSNHVLSARARGLGSVRVLARHVIPGARPVLAAQFWSSVPMFILAEANLSFLGLGVTEPASSWGTMLKEMESAVASGLPAIERYWVFIPALPVLLSVVCLTVLFPSRVNT
jgi:peptide/nickel transport system permease protein